MKQIFLFGAAIALANCSNGDLGMPTVAIGSSASDLAFLNAAVSQHAGRNRPSELRQVQIYALPDGSRIGCGDWDAPDPYGGFGGYAPFYVRYTGGQVSRVHLDDLTGYGPAQTGCYSAHARLTGASS
ncbi:hypothetical protein [Flavimaricola marinus]|uniref:Uncharacterized protein n=1 Tax=Flavimaricola marinus TaxID=1819565 RepID=A0A238LGS4_9RHOB|nr:hypothetical protein [Flavimaricola marinus]SMY08614.1 hypothetical protein LOM8899_02769 [Flavimaricola marinus]